MTMCPLHNNVCITLQHTIFFTMYIFIYTMYIIYIYISGVKINALTHAINFFS